MNISRILYYIMDMKTHFGVDAHIKPEKESQAMELARQSLFRVHVAGNYFLSDTMKYRGKGPS